MKVLGLFLKGVYGQTNSVSHFKLFFKLPKITIINIKINLIFKVKLCQEVSNMVGVPSP